jgi:hypothetical protein
VIIRQALADEALEFDVRHSRPSDSYDESPERDGCLSAEVRLFAPAIFGFHPTNFGGFCYNLMAEIPVLGRFLRPMVRSSPVHSELEPGSQRLLEIRRRTEELAAKYSWMRALSAHLIFGAGELRSL